MSDCPVAALRLPHGHFDSRLPAPPAQPASSDAGDVAKVGMSPQHLSEIESGKRDPRLSSIERMAEAMGMTVLIVPDAMAPDLRRYVANNGRIYITHAGQAAAAPNHSEAPNPDHAQEKT
jgi:hypothetical protein